MSPTESDGQLPQAGSTCRPGRREHSQTSAHWALIVDRVWYLGQKAGSGWEKKQERKIDAHVRVLNSTLERVHSLL